MRIHHLNCGSMCPASRRLVQGEGSWLEPADICCHCLLLETDAGLVLVDSGIASRDLNVRTTRIPLPLRLLFRPVLDPARSALHQVEALGFDRRDVRHILVTHLDFDHAGGISDFPDAQVHLFADEYEALTRPRGAVEKHRYLRHVWSSATQFKPHALAGEGWEGFEAVRAPIARDTDVLFVPLAGHTRGHAAIAVRSDDGWLLHCGDAYFHRGELQEPPACPPVLALYQQIGAYDNRARLRNQTRLRALKAISGERIRPFSAHDPVELSHLRMREQVAHPERARESPTL
jgi:glyoxylase-like metal-dependent hydrolase (beta-lactamase superfamily II)